VVKDALDPGDRSRFVRVRNGRIDLALLSGRERLSEIFERGLDLADLLRKRLQRHRHLGGSMRIGRSHAGACAQDLDGSNGASFLLSHG